MAYWLMKSEPNDYSIDDLKKDGREPWDGIRNYQARNMMRDDMKIGDLVFFYHSSCKEPGVVGIAKIASKPYADPTQFDKKAKHYDAKSDEIPITLGGAARHNVANALSAAALTWCLGMPVNAIREGLTTMAQEENPGRCNLYELDGFKVLVDFAHNPAAMHALFDMAQAIPANRRVLCFGQAGDRPDELIRNMTRDAWSIGLDQVMISELADYHRGREHGDVYAVMKDELLASGATESQLVHHEEEIDSFRAAVEWAQPGDLVIMLALGGAAPIQEQLKALGAT